jgi:ferric enterobactin receptor
LYTSGDGRNSNNISQLTNYLNGTYPPSGSQGNNPGTDRETDISVDYTQPVSKAVNLQTGAKVAMETINNNVATDTLLNNGSYVPDAGQTNSFVFKRNIYAAYLSATFKLFNDFLNGEAGLRYERTNTTTDFSSGNIPGYNLWAPSLLLQHKFNESESLKFAYSYRVERPDYGDLNPFLDIMDQHDISTGNPLLKTEIGHKYEFGYSKSFDNEDNIYIGLYYNYNSNDIQSITTYYPVYSIDGANYYDLSLAQAVNIGSQTAYGSSLSGSFAVTDKLNFRSDVRVRELVNAEPGQPSVIGFTYKVNANLTYQLLPDLAAEVFGNYTSRRIEFHDSHPALLFYTAAIRKQFDDKKASFGITATNPFNRYVNQLSTNYGSNFTQNYLREIPLRSFGLTLAYKFGKTEIQKKNEEQADPQAPSL